MREPLPLATVQEAVLEFLRGRDDVVVFGAQAVNAYVDEARMTQDVDLLAADAQCFAGELRRHLNATFHIAVRVRKVSRGRGYRIFQTRKEGSRHLVDVRAVDRLPRVERIAGVQVVAPADLIAMKVLAYHRRQGQPKAGTDWRDLAMLLLAFPELKQSSGPVRDRLHDAGAEPEVLRVWQGLVDQKMRSEDEEDDF